MIETEVRVKFKDTERFKDATLLLGWNIEEGAMSSGMQQGPIEIGGYRRKAVLLTSYFSPVRLIWDF